jgi:hypothetical protein
MASKTLTADEVRAMLADVDHSTLTITDDPAVWIDLFTGESGTSVRIDGPEEARQAAFRVLFGRGLANAPYLDHDEWSR